MITGHLGIAALVRSRSRTRMGSILFSAFAVAAYAPDIVDTLYFAFGICSPYGLYSHTLHAVVLQTAVIAGAAFLATGSKAVARDFAILVLLHLAADYFTGHKLFVPGGEIHGLFWYDTPAYDAVLELSTVALGWLLLRRSGRAPRWATTGWVLAAALLIQAAFDIASARSGAAIKPTVCFASGPGAGLPAPLGR